MKIEDRGCEREVWISVQRGGTTLLPTIGPHEHGSMASTMWHSCQRTRDAMLCVGKLPFQMIQIRLAGLELSLKNGVTMISLMKMQLSKQIFWAVQGRVEFLTIGAWTLTSFLSSNQSSQQTYYINKKEIWKRLQVFQDIEGFTYAEIDNHMES